MTLSMLIKQFLDDNDLNYDEFAAMIGKTKGYISMLINEKNPKTGKPMVPTVSTYSAIAKAMNMSLNTLLRTIDDAPIRLEETSQSQEDDFTDEEMWQIREDFRRNPELRALLSMTRNASKKEVKQIEAFIRAIRSSNDYEEDDTP